MKIKPIVLNIEKSIWKEFISYIPSTRTKNGTIIELIEKHNMECRKNESRSIIPKR